MTTKSLLDKALAGDQLSAPEALELAQRAGLPELFAAATALRERYRGRAVDLCSIVSARTGGCSEDCAYCAQSVHASVKTTATALMQPQEIAARARAARASGARRFCIVTGGRKPSPRELDSIARTFPLIRAEGLLTCATLGLLDRHELSMLKDAGLMRFHHNLETSRRFFPSICSTHSYEDKLRTIEAVRDSGLSLCSGGIFGLGETWQDRALMAGELRAISADSIPINFLVPIQGTPLGGRKPLDPEEALRVVGLMRLVMPEREVRICGGRLQTLGVMDAMVFAAGADGLLTGDCLTVAGRAPDDDLRLIAEAGLEPAGPYLATQSNHSASSSGTASSY